MRAQLERAGQQLRGEPVRSAAPTWRECAAAGEPYQDKDVLEKPTWYRDCPISNQPVTSCACAKCGTDLGHVRVMTAAYRAVTVTKRHSDSVLNGIPSHQLTYCLWDDNSPWPEAGIFHQYAVAKARRGFDARYFRAETFGVRGQGHMAQGFNFMLQGHGGHVLVTESDCILPPNWYSLYARAVKQAPENWGIIAGLTVNESGQIELPDTDRIARQGLTVAAKGLTETDNTCLAGALVNRACIAKGLWFNPKWPFLRNSIGIGDKLRSAGYRNFLCAEIPILHYPHTSRNIRKLEKADGQPVHNAAG